MHQYMNLLNWSRHFLESTQHLNTDEDCKLGQFTAQRNAFDLVEQYQIKEMNIRGVVLIALIVNQSQISA